MTITQVGELAHGRRTDPSRLLLLVIFGWPVLMIAFYLLHAKVSDHSLVFVESYFLNVPHRWLTFFLLPTRGFYRRNTSLVYFLAVGVLVTYGALYAVTRSFEFIVIIDYLWNGWHFASQHYGVARILESPQQPRSRRTENFLIRFFVMYAILRFASFPQAANPTLVYALKVIGGKAAYLDYLVLSIPAWLIAREWLRMDQNASSNKLFYWSSVYLQYAAFLYFINTHNATGLLAISFANTAFHCGEYMILGFHRLQLRGVHVAGLLLLGIVLIPVFTGGFTAAYARPLYVVAFIVSALHYGYDTFLWRNRRNAKPALALA
jgi:hypothetical protein